MTLDDKIYTALATITKVVSHYRNPIVMSSFGKDSMVLLDLVRRAGFKFPVLFHREPFFPEKYDFANRQIVAGDYEVYDYPPSGTSLIQGNGNTDIVNWYQVGKKFAFKPVGILEPDFSLPWLCGLKLYRRPLAQSVDFPWDLVFVGHKSSDVDTVFGPVPLTVDLVKNEGAADYLYPLRHFTDADIWRYTFETGIAYDNLRYTAVPTSNSWAENHRVSNDHFHACIRCMDRTTEPVVECPLTGLQITNISASLQYSDLVRPSFLAEVQK